jgi:enoyl-CoA hydratase/carnithine racemase
VANLLVQNDADGVLFVTLNRPERLNALSLGLRDELRALWSERKSDPDLRCVVVTGAGRAFCAGADMEELSTGVSTGAIQTAEAALSFLPAHVLDVPVIAAINGLCVGGGLQFLADADFAIGSDSAWFSDPHVTMGQVSAVEHLRLVAKLPAPAIVRLMLLGSSYRMSAEEAKAAHLITEVVPAERLQARALELAHVIAGQSPTAVRVSLGFIRNFLRRQVAEDVEAAWHAVDLQRSHPDAAEGPRAFAEKRPPRWATVALVR